ncbi:carbohydrate ABC transporter permease [Halalkalibacterium halodurans]|uniref:Transmembrane lipoprotein n=1 Tax=Halalkalibacterium halodurans (strain ATCC BAA-125 / DSM 18197 / FERM 7344 / JCM 9153 / C-125) TaxID=272558 RepID=Q9KBL4_HALH5|nr:carbohydrate ABC transporter permease [Halalkalibacterium halodurans]MDY7222474.1 carbohydrate ABC transporter permease [Halalkalibacterium halodurans]MDY7241695.1 carbohydrate ABC transporter permease [Halalkalibacterium halodurans]MED4082674.1 carbohydrate ABC transporter permease [Halalkalibacterium halodurans]MED4085874.1 carbohydrate ABC transporter permease [Halalkalibacterium halodurans]MED4106842.1 carbohydrate ABC transporter permease [Halalkalibacterium halodurans]
MTGKWGDRLFDWCNYLFLTMVLLVTLYPFLNVLAISLNDSVDTVRGGIYIWPREFTLENYRVIFEYDHLVTGFINSVLRTVIGTVLGVFSSAMVAFTLSRGDFQARKFVSTIIVLTLYFSGGLIPGYMLIRELNLINTFWVYVLPGMVNAFHIIIVRSFMDGLPYSLQESAKIDGANDFTIFWRIILPLCTPVLATIALFVAVGQWNAWFDTYLYNSSNPNLTTLQYELMKILQNTTMSASDANAFRGTSGEDHSRTVSPESIKMAISMITIIPILLVYPFVQRFFVKGMTLGAVKS